MIIARSPLRISLGGGGTDLASYYRDHGGYVLAGAINKYVYVHIKKHDPLFQELFRISYSQVEHTESRNQIKNGIVKSCLELLEIDEPLQISTSADLPASSGLGSSSTFATALLQGLHSLNGRKVSAKQLAEEASHVEIEMLKEPIGKQDQYAAAFGGLNYCEFNANEKVKIEHLEISLNFIEKIPIRIKIKQKYFLTNGSRPGFPSSLKYIGKIFSVISQTLRFNISLQASASVCN